jgi:hypothetical protein
VVQRRVHTGAVKRHPNRPQWAERWAAAQLAEVAPPARQLEGLAVGPSGAVFQRTRPVYFIERLHKDASTIGV